MQQENRFAVLIDSDNISPKYIDEILEEIKNYGNITYKRIYGDWTSQRMSSWKDALAHTAISPIQQYSYTQGKNATDSAMIIDAMDILYTGDVEGFCIVSSDSDFTRLAVRLREAGMIVIGMGEKKTPKAFTSACNIFKYIDILSKQEDKVEKVEVDDSGDVSMTDVAVIEAAIVDFISDADNQRGMDIAELGNRLIKSFPEFDVRNYGYSKLSTFLMSLRSVSLRKTSNTLRAFSNVELKDIENIIVELIKESPKETINMGELNNKLLKICPNMNLRGFGYTKFQTLLENIDKVKIIPNSLNVTLK